MVVFGIVVRVAPLEPFLTIILIITYYQVLVKMRNSPSVIPLLTFLFRWSVKGGCVRNRDIIRHCNFVIFRQMAL